MLSVWPTGRGVRGYEGQEKFAYRKWASHCWLSFQNFIFPPRKFFLVLGAFGLWGGSARSTPPPPVDKHITGRGTRSFRGGCYLHFRRLCPPPAGPPTVLYSRDLAPQLLFQPPVAAWATTLETLLQPSQAHPEA